MGKNGVESPIYNIISFNYYYKLYIALPFNSIYMIVQQGKI